MSRSLLILAALTGLFLSVGGHAQDNEPDVFKEVFGKDTPMSAGQPSVEIPAVQIDPEDIQDGETRTFTRRYLRVVNSSKEQITVFLQYLAKRDGQELWLPGTPEEGLALSYVLEPNQELKLDHLDRYITASRVRLWANSEYWVWENYKTKDLSLVDEPGGSYQNTTMGTYYYYFMGAEFPDIGKAEAVPVNPDPPPAVAFVPVPQRIVDPIPIPDFTPEPDVVIVREADLSVADFRVDPNGVFQGTISNLGPNRYQGGRRWFLLQSGTPEGKLLPVKSGRIDPLFPTRLQHVFGNIKNLDKGSRLVFAISRGDANQANDSSGMTFITPAKADLAVANMKLVGNQVVATVINNGPAAYDGKRTFNLNDTLGLVKPQRGAVPPLASGASTTFTLNLAAASLNAQNLFVMRISPGDDFPANDAKLRSFTPKVTQPDLAAVEVRVEGSRLIGVIANLGPGNYTQGARTFTLTHTTPMQGSQAVVATITQPIPNLTDGDRHDVSVMLKPGNLKAPGTMKLTITAGDGRAGNDQLTRAYTPLRKGDLAVSNLMLNGTTLTGVIRNVGGVPYTSGQREFYLGVKVNKQSSQTGKTGPIPSLSVGAQTTVSFAVPPVFVGGPFVLVLEGDSSGDSNRDNDSVTLLPDMPPPPPTKKRDLAVSNLALNGNILTGVIRNVGNIKYTSGDRKYFMGAIVPKNGVNVRHGTSAAIPSIAVGAQTTVSYTVPPPFLGHSLWLTLDADESGDSDRSNDSIYTKPAVVTPPTKPDLEAKTLAFNQATKKLSFTIVNNGPGNYASGASYSISGTGIGVVDSGTIPALAQGAPFTKTQLDLASSLNSVAAGTQVTLTLQVNYQDSNPGNNAARTTAMGTKPANVAAKPAQLAITSLTRPSGRVTGIVQNVGGSEVKANSGTVTFVHYKKGSKVRSNAGTMNVGNLKPGQAQVFTINDPGPGRIEMRLNSSVADPSRDMKSVQ